MNVTVGQWLSAVSHHDREYILRHVLSKKRSEIYLLWEESLTENQLKRCSHILSRYEKGEPLAYILGEVDFYGCTFMTDPQVFIPRPETEILVGAVLDHYQMSHPPYFVDFGCGSGAIGLSLLRKWPQSRLLAVDKNQKALDLTSKNAEKFQLKDRLQVCCQDVVGIEIKNSVELITANPPYIAKGDSRLHSSVEKYEPESALFSEWLGMKAVETWLDKACSILSAEGGNYFFEIGYNQYSEVENLLKNKNLVDSFSVYKDYQGYKRIVHCVIKKNIG